MHSVCRPTSKPGFHQPQRYLLSPYIDRREREKQGPGHVCHVHYCHYHEGTVMRHWTFAASETIERHLMCVCVTCGKHMTEDQKCRFCVLVLLDTC